MHQRAMNGIVGVFTSHSDIHTNDLHINVFDSQQLALKWMIQTLVDCDLVEERDGSWLFEDEEYKSREDVLEAFQYTCAGSQYFHMYPVTITHATETVDVTA